MFATRTLALVVCLNAISALSADPNSGGVTPQLGAPGAPPGPPITLAEAQARAVDRNPELAAAVAAARAADGARRQARALPNPEFSIDFDGFGGTIPEQTEAQTLFALEQPIEIGGKRKARTREREFAQSVAQSEAEIRRRDVFAEVRRRFVRVIGAQERARIQEEVLHTAEAVQRTVHELVAAGEVSPIEELKVEADASLARIDLGAASSALAVARQELAQMWGDRAPDFGPAVGDLEAPAMIPARSELEQQLGSLPDISRSKADVTRLEAALASEKKKRIPDLALSAGVQHYRAFDEHSFVAGVKIALPIFNSNAGAIAEASSRLEQGRREGLAAEAQVVGALATAHERLVATSREVVALRDTVLPRTRQVLEGIEEGYRRGKFRLLELLDARRSLAAAELRYNDALINFNVAAADVERWTGAPTAGTQGETQP